MLRTSIRISTAGRIIRPAASTAYGLGPETSLFSYEGFSFTQNVCKQAHTAKLKFGTEFSEKMFLSGVCQPILSSFFSFQITG